VGGSKEQTVGYRYFMGLHMAICHGPVDSIDQVYFGKRSLELSSVTDNTTVLARQPALFGGDEKEGGIVGNIDYEFGAGDQTTNDYLVSQFGSATPAFRFVTCAVFRAHDSSDTALTNYISQSGGGYLAAMSPYPKPWAFAVTDIPGGGFNPSKQIVNDVANGGHIIYDCLTNADWGLGISGTDIDSTSFTEVTDTLYDEDFGLSFIYAQQSKMEDFIQQVLDHINGILYNDRQTGEFKLKLIRDDYETDDLPIFDETNIASLVSFERPAFSQMVNEIVLTYRKRGDLNDSTIAVQDLASIQAQGLVISQSVSFDGIDDADLAAKIALRELHQASTPLARAKLVVNREAWEIVPGDVIKLTWEDYGIEEFILRVGSVDYGSLENPLVVINAVEDIFSQPTVSYLSPVTSGWVEEVVDPIPAVNEVVVELPYFVLNTTFTQATLDSLNEGDCFLQMVIEPPSAGTYSFALQTRQDQDAYITVTNGAPAPTALLASVINQTDTTSISIKSFQGNSAQITEGSYAYLNEEILRIDSVDVVNGLVDVGRGYMDSYPRSHPIDSIIYFCDAGFSAVTPDTTPYVLGDSIDAKALTQTGQGLLDEADATAHTLVMQERALLPYNASQVKINNTYFPDLVESPQVKVTWEYQDRTQQLDIGGDDWYNVALSEAETGVLFEVRYYNDDTSTLLQTDTNVSGKEALYTSPDPIGTTFTMRVEIDAIRTEDDDSEYTSYYTFVYTFTYVNPLRYRTTSTGDRRVLENADERILE